MFLPRPINLPRPLRIPPPAPRPDNDTRVLAGDRVRWRGRIGCQVARCLTRHTGTATGVVMRRYWFGLSRVMWWPTARRGIVRTSELTRIVP